MEALFVIFAILLLTLIAQSVGSRVEDKPVAAITSNQIVVARKQCPPHQWDWQEVIDQDGKKYGERIICKVCGPLKVE